MEKLQANIQKQVKSHSSLEFQVEYSKRNDLKKELIKKNSVLTLEI